MIDTKNKQENNLILSAIGAFLLTASLFTIGTVNLSQVWSLMTEITDNTNVIVGLVIMGITITIVMTFGDWFKALLNKTIKR